MRSADRTLPRRRFLERLTALVPALALGSAAAPGSLSAAASGPDDRWMRGLTGKHRTVFDVESHRNGHVLGQMPALLDTYERAYGVAPRDVNLVLGVRGTALPIVMGDAVWAKFALGERYAITDP